MAREGARIGTFGGVHAWDPSGAEVSLTPAERRLLAGLALATPATVSDDRLVELLWRTERPPPTARQSLQNHISRLRRKLGPDAICRRSGGYAVGPAVAVDLREFEDGLKLMRSSDDDPTTQLELVERLRALAGEAPLLDLENDSDAAGARAAVSEAREQLNDRWADLLIGTGQPERAVGELERLVAASPARERRWELLLVALERAGRPADALNAYHRARRTLVESFGVTPGPTLEAVYRRLLDITESSDDNTGTSPLIRRPRSVEAIRSTLDSHSVVHLRGPAGIGKSTVLALLAQSWTGTVWRADCSDNPWSALGPIEGLLGRLSMALPDRGLPAGIADLRDPVQREALGRLRPPEGITSRAVDVITSAMDAVSAPLLLVDDLDRAGPSTRDVLLRVAAHPSVHAVLSSRVPDLLAGTVSDEAIVDLGGFDDDELSDVARLQGVADDEAQSAASWLAEHTGGHPLFATQLLATVVDDRPWATVASQDAEPDLSESLLALLRARLAALPAGCRTALDAAAVMGDHLDMPLLRQLVDVGHLAPALDAGVLAPHPDGGFRFAHGLLRKAAYDSMPPGRRQELHHALGLRSTDASVRAHHLERSADLDPGAAIAALSAAGRAAVSDQAYGDAASWFRRAAALASNHGAPPTELLELRLESSDCARLAGEPGHAEPLLDLAEQALGHDHHDLRRRATIAATQLGEAVDAGPLQRRAAAIADRAIAAEDDPTWRGRLQATASILHSISGDPDRCRSLFVEAMHVLDEDDRHGSCEVLPYAYMALAHPDDLPLREDAARRLLGASVAAGDAVAEWEAHHLACSTAIARGDGPRLRRAFGQCRRLLAASGDAGRRWSTRYIEAAIADIDGDLDRAERLTDEALTLGLGVAPVRAMAAASGQLLGLRWQQGRLEELAETIETLVAQQPEMPAWRAAGALVFADLCPEQSLRWFDELVGGEDVGLLRDFSWLAGILCLGEAAVRLGDRRRASRILPVLEPYTHLVCWQGTCSYGPVAAVAERLADVIGDPRAQMWRRQAHELSRNLRGAA